MPAKISLYRSLRAQIIPKEITQTSKNNEKIIPGQMLGQDRPEKNSGKCLIRSGDITSARQASVDKTNDSVMNYERGALVRGSDPPSGHSHHNTTDGS